MRFRSVLLGCLLTSLVFGESGLGVDLPGPKDYVEADSASYQEGMLWELRGNVKVHLESLFEETPIEITAETVTYHDREMKLYIPEDVKVALPAFQAFIAGRNLRLDLKNESGNLEDISAELSIPKDYFQDETGLLDLQYVRFLESAEPRIKLRKGNLELFHTDDGELCLKFTGSEMLSSADENADFVIKVKELLYAPNRYLSVRNLRVSASGVTIFYLPRFKRRPKGGIGLLGQGSFLPGRDVEDGYYILSGNFIDRGDFHADIYNKYYLDRGLWSEAFIFTEPTDSSRIGVSFGRSRTKDLFRRSVGETKYFDFYFRDSSDVDLPLVKSFNAGVNVGRIKQDEPQITSTRGYAFVEGKTKPIVFTEKTRGIASTSVHYYKYEYGDADFLAFRHRFKLANETAYGLDYVEFIHADKFGSSPFRFDDNFPENQLTFQKNTAPLPNFSTRVYGKYNFDLDHFDNLVVGVSREFRSYYGGFYYDFARASVGLEFALKF